MYEETPCVHTKCVHTNTDIHVCVGVLFTDEFYMCVWVYVYMHVHVKDTMSGFRYTVCT